MNSLMSLAQGLAGVLDPARYVESVGISPYEWQVRSLDPGLKRLVLLCARQSGKSTVVAGKCVHKAKFTPGSLNIIVSPSKDQSEETMKKVEDFIAMDPFVSQGLVKDSTFEKELGNRARIIALPGTERSVRGYSAPTTIIIDEASRVEDATFKATRPMMVTNPNAEMILLSTPWGKQGFFYEAWANQDFWTKVFVKPAFRLDGGKIVDDIPESEFRKMWAQRGVFAWYSPHHTREFLEEELQTLGEHWWQQEYGCEFLDGTTSIFSTDDIMAAIGHNELKLYGDDDIVGDNGALQF